jgi:hypothetical protein
VVFVDEGYYIGEWYGKQKSERDITVFDSMFNF